MGEFPFHPELFEAWGRALAALADAGLMWLSHFKSMDLEHDVYGLSVHGIEDDDVAIDVARCLMTTFPDWPWGTIYLDTINLDKGWVVRISRDMDDTRGEGEGGRREPRPDTLPAAIARLRMHQRLSREEPPDAGGAAGEAGATTQPEAATAGPHDPALRELRAALRALADGPHEQPTSPEQRLQLVVLYAITATTYRRAGDHAASLRHLRRAAHRSNPEARPFPRTLPPDIDADGLPDATREEIGWWWWLSEGGGFDAEACRVLGALLPVWAKHADAQATLRACQAYIAIKTRLWPMAG